MDIRITGRNLELNSDVKKYIEKKLGKMDRFYDRVDRCDVILEQEKIRQIAEIIVYLRRTNLVARESSTDIYASIDMAAEVIKKRLRRLRGKVTAKRRKAVLSRFMWN